MRRSGNEEERDPAHDAWASVWQTGMDHGRATSTSLSAKNRIHKKNLRMTEIFVFLPPPSCSATQLSLTH